MRLPQVFHGAQEYTKARSAIFAQVSLLSMQADARPCWPDDLGACNIEGAVALQAHYAVANLADPTPCVLKCSAPAACDSGALCVAPDMPNSPVTGIKLPILRLTGVPAMQSDEDDQALLLDLKSAECRHQSCFLCPSHSRSWRMVWTIPSGRPLTLSTATRSVGLAYQLHEDMFSAI